MQGMLVPDHDPVNDKKTKTHDIKTPFGHQNSAGPRVALLGPIYADKLKAL